MLENGEKVNLKMVKKYWKKLWKKTFVVKWYHLRRFNKIPAPFWEKLQWIVCKRMFR